MTVAFDEIGLPGFIFLRDDIEYYSRTQHENLNTTDGSRWILQIQATNADYKSLGYHRRQSVEDPSPAFVPIEVSSLCGVHSIGREVHKEPAHVRFTEGVHRQCE
jgi:hypothetical protein